MYLSSRIGFLRFYDNYHQLELCMHGRILLGVLLSGAMQILNLSCFSSIGLWYIVQRTKLCLDFACTVYFLHLVACVWYNSGLPYTLSWWLINIVCTAILCVTGEFLCMRTELQSIPVRK